MKEIKTLFTKVSKYIKIGKKYLAELKIPKKRFLTIVIIGCVILMIGMIIVYFYCKCCLYFRIECYTQDIIK